MATVGLLIAGAGAIFFIVVFGILLFTVGKYYYQYTEDLKIEAEMKKAHLQSMQDNNVFYNPHLKDK